MKHLNKLLIISVILNVFFIGMFSGQLLRKFNRNFRDKPQERLISKQERKHFRQNLRSAQRNLKKELMIDPFNERKVSIAFDGVHMVVDQHFKGMKQRLLIVAPTLSPKERIKLLPHFKHKRKRRR